MGEAKRRKAAHEAELKSMMYLEIEKWDRLDSDWEADLISEIDALPRVKVERPTSDQLKFMRMKPKECHTNARAYVELDPKGDTRMVTGWWKQDDRFIHHSIVGRNDGAFFCVTPLMVPNADPMEFIPDDKIEWRDEGEERIAYRNGQEIGPGLRSDVPKARRINAAIKAALDAGISPIDAARLANEVE